MTPRLSRTTAPTSALLLPDGTPAQGIVHLGLGNFHRAHMAVYTAKAVAHAGGDWGILAYSFRSTTIAEAMSEQELLYSVVTIDPAINSIDIPGIHTRVLAGPEYAAEVVAAIAAAQTKIVSLTITEAGYKISQSTNGLDFTSPEIAADLTNDASPRTAIGMIAYGLALRSTTHRTPITILSCDNLSANGDRTRSLLLEFVAAMTGTAELISYINECVTFPNSMVDRIVPGTEARHLAMVEERLGVHDSTPVPAEAFTMWVIEDHFAAGRPAWDAVGAIMSDEVELYEILKLRLLNGAHSLIAYLGGLAQCETIPDSRFQPFIEDAINKALFHEYLPTLTLPRGLNAHLYIDQLFGRWSNTALGDRTSRVGSDGSAKLPQRVATPATFHINQGQMPHMLALTVAAYLACIAPLAGFEPGPVAREMKDPLKERLQAVAGQSHAPEDFVSSVFQQNIIFAPEIAALPGFVDQISTYLRAIMESGIEAATRLALAN
jgi:fructuronate reductase